MKIALRVLTGLILLAALIVVGLYLWGQPIQQIPGRKLRGNVITEPVSDWSFVNKEGICQIEVNAEAPRSVTIACYGAPNGLYVTHDIIPNARKSWAEFLVEDPTARIKFDGDIYPVKATRIFDPAERQKISKDRHAAIPRRGPSFVGQMIGKIQRLVMPPPAAAAPRATHGGVPDNEWLFRLESR